MNSVEIKNQKEKISLFKTGDIFTDNGEQYYILSSYKEKYMAICLDDGIWWAEPSKSITSAIGGLTFVGRDMIIEISE